MLLTLIIFLPLAVAGVIMLLPRDLEERIPRIALAGSLAALALTIIAGLSFWSAAASDPAGAGTFRLKATAAWLPAVAGGSAVDIAYRVGVDGVSIWLLLLTALLSPLAIWSSFSGIRERIREYYVLMLVLESAMLGVFCALDLLLFYVFFEFTLIPLYFLIGIWGGAQKRWAAIKFFVYTVAGSVLTFAGILFLAYYGYQHGPNHVFTLDIEKLTALGQSGIVPAGVQWWLFIAFAAGLAVKVPLFPLHTWLPLAHTEAPTAGSVILAGVLLKLGTYGFCRLTIPMLPEAAFTVAPFIAVLAIIGIIYTALAAWVQSDVKKLVAYSSVSHLGFCMLGLFSLKLAGVNGAVAYMVNHGLSTGALFLVVGCIYERYHTRDIHAIGGLARRMPIMAFFLVFFTLSSIGLPGLNGFVGEFLTLLGTATSNTAADGIPAGPLGFGYAVPAATGIILSAVYMLWMCRCVLFGPLKEPEHTPDTSSGLGQDLTRREIWILAPIAACCVLLGVYPKPMLASIESAAVANVLRNPNFRLTYANLGAESQIANGARGEARIADVVRSEEGMANDGIASASNGDREGEPRASARAASRTWHSVPALRGTHRTRVGTNGKTVVLTSSARKAHDRSQGHQSLVGGPFSDLPARRADQARDETLVRPPGGRELEGSGSQGLKPLATNVRPPGEEEWARQVDPGSPMVGVRHPATYPAEVSRAISPETPRGLKPAARWLDPSVASCEHDDDSPDPNDMHDVDVPNDAIHADVSSDVNDANDPNDVTHADVSEHVDDANDLNRVNQARHPNGANEFTDAHGATTAPLEPAG